MKKYPTSEYTELHVKLLTELISRLEGVSILSEQYYDSSYFIIEGDSKRFYVNDLIEKKETQKYIDYVERRKKDQGLLFVYKVFKFDIYIPSLSIVIEIDGDSHKSVTRELKDQKKDEYLKEQGFTIWRIKEEEIDSKTKLLAVAAELVENIITHMTIKATRRVR